MAERYESIMRRCRDAAGRIGASRKELREEMKLLGLDLIAAKSMVRHGEWESVLAEYGIHVWTAKRAMRIAEGKDLQKVQVVRKRSGEPNDFAGDSGDRDTPVVVEDDWDLPAGSVGAEFEDEEEEEESPLGAAGAQLALAEIYERMDAARARVILRLDQLRMRGDAEALAEMERMAGMAGGGGL